MIKQLKFINNKTFRIAFKNRILFDIFPLTENEVMRLQDDLVMDLNKKQKKSLEGTILKYRNEYKNQWLVDSETINERNHYDWMESFISPYHFILEIGTGVGLSTLKLLNSGHKVVSIDENIECLKQAYSLLTSQGKKIKLIRRGFLSSKININHKYRINYEIIDKNININDFDAILIEADALNENDSYFFDWLDSLGDFDAIVCWLIGTHSARKNNENIMSWVNSPADYRLSVQNKVYELADRILKSNGVLHVVDRAPEINEEIKQTMITCHVEQASVTNLKFSSIDFKNYGSIDADGVGMVNQEDHDNIRMITRVDTEKSIFLTSVLSVKP